VTYLNLWSTFSQIPDTIIARQAHLETELSIWIQAFAPLYERVCTEKEIVEPSFDCAYHTVVRMRLQSMAIMILNAGLVIKSEIDYDKFNPQFEEMLELASIIKGLRQRRKENSNWAGSFWTDICISLQLFRVATRCWDLVIRRRAIQMLEGWYMEGGLDPKLITQVGMLIMEMEEERAEELDWGGRKKGVIPESARVVFSRTCENAREGGRQYNVRSRMARWMGI
jgi:hypothetical protein